MALVVELSGEPEPSAMTSALNPEAMFNEEADCARVDVTTPNKASPRVNPIILDFTTILVIILEETAYLMPKRVDLRPV